MATYTVTKRDQQTARLAELREAMVKAEAARAEYETLMQSMKADAKTKGQELYAFFKAFREDPSASNYVTLLDGMSNFQMFRYGQDSRDSLCRSCY